MEKNHSRESVIAAVIPHTMRSLLFILFALAGVLVGCDPPLQQSDVSPSSPLQAIESKSSDTDDPLREMLKSATANDITSLSIVLVVIDHESNPGTQETKFDITSEAEQLLPLLKNSRLVDSGHFGVGMWPTGTLKLTTNNGLKLEISLYPFGFFLKQRVSTDEHPIVFQYDSELKHFWNALKYDQANRIYSEESYRELLLQYAKRSDEEIDAFTELARSFRDPRIVQLIPAYLKKSDRVLLSLEHLENIDDQPAIAAVLRHLYSNDINTSRQAADVLDSWGQLSELNRRTFSPSEDDLNNVDGGSASFCTHMAFWYAEHGRYSDAVKIVRTYGIDRFDLTYAYSLLRPLEPNDETSFVTYPEPTESERLEILLLMADIIENRSGQLFVIFLRDLWDAMGVQYDADTDKLVPRNEELEPYIDDDDTGKKAANAIRRWLQEKPND